MYVLTLQLKDFSAAHRLIKSYRGKCNHLHGHNYSLKIQIASDSLESDTDLVLDFKVARELCNRWVQDNLDHSTLVCSQDQSLLEFLQQNQQRYYEFVDGKNSSAECLAQHIYRALQEIISDESQSHQNNIHLLEVELWESKTSAATYRPGKVQLTGVNCGL